MDFCAHQHCKGLPRPGVVSIMGMASHDVFTGLRCPLSWQQILSWCIVSVPPLQSHIPFADAKDAGSDRTAREGLSVNA